MKFGGDIKGSIPITTLDLVKSPESNIFGN